MLEQIIVHGIIFLVMLFLYITSFSFPVLNIGGKLGAAWWPQLVLGAGMVLTAVSAFQSVRKLRASGEKPKLKITKNEVFSIGFSAGIIVITLLLVQTMGFLVTIPVMIFGFMFQLGCRKPLTLILVSIIGAMVFTLVFGRIMEISLPRGMGIMRTISFYIY